MKVIKFCKLKFLKITKRSLIFQMSINTLWSMPLNFAKYLVIFLWYLYYSDSSSPNFFLYWVSIISYTSATFRSAIIFYIFLNATNNYWWHEYQEDKGCHMTCFWPKSKKIKSIIEWLYWNIENSTYQNKNFYIFTYL